MTDLPDYTIAEYVFQDVLGSSPQRATVRLCSANRQYAVITEHSFPNRGRKPITTCELFNSYTAAFREFNKKLEFTYGVYSYWNVYWFPTIDYINTRIPAQEEEDAKSRLLQNIRNGIRRIDFNL